MSLDGLPFTHLLEIKWTYLSKGVSTDSFMLVQLSRMNMVTNSAANVIPQRT